MATRIDKNVHNLELNSENLLSYLKRRGGRKSSEIRYVGAVRNNALSDLTNRGEALENVLDYVTRITDSREVELYGKYSSEDFNITKEFVENSISKEFLLPLKDVSVTDEGSEISINPRLRIEDRLKAADGLAGRGAFDNLHKGPTAVFYKINPGTYEDAGTLRLSGGFNSTTGLITSPVVTRPGGYQVPTSGVVAYILADYPNPNDTTKTLTLSGLDVYVLVDYDASPVTWTVGDIFSINKLKGLQNTFPSNFNDIVFDIKQEYSLLNVPTWFTMSPGDTNKATNGGPDDINADTSNAVLTFERGLPKLYIEDEYYSTGNYVTYRIPDDNRNDYNGNNIVKDSNMKFDRPPRVLLDNETIANWGVRWDGYLRIDEVDQDRKYVFEVQTNVGLRIDLVTGGTDSNPVWSEIINTTNPAAHTSFLSAGDQGEFGQKYFPKNSFVLDNLPPKFAYYTSIDGPTSTSKRYVPISIRMWNGATDKSDPSRVSATFPNIFIKTGYSETSPNTQDVFYSEEPQVTIRNTGSNTIIEDVPAGSTLDNSIIDAGGQTQYDVISYFEEVTAPGYEYNSIQNGSGFTPGRYENIQFSYVSDSGDGTVPSKDPIFTITISSSGSIEDFELTSEGEGISDDSEFTYLGDALGDNGSGADPVFRYVFNASITKTVEVSITPSRVYLQHATPGNISTPIRAYSDAAFTTQATAFIQSGPPVITSYRLRLIPSSGTYNLNTNWDDSLLWSTRIAGPKAGYNGYDDLIDIGGINYEPNIFKLPFDEKPDYWKAREGKRYIFHNGTVPVQIDEDNDPLDGWESNFFKDSLESNAYRKGLYGDGSFNYTTRKNLILGEAKYSSSDKDSSNYIGVRLTTNDLGEGGLFKFTGIPIDNALGDYSGVTENKNKPLDQNDLGGGSNHQTVVSTSGLTPETIQMFWRGGRAGTDEFGDKFFLHADIESVTASDNPTANGGYPAFGTDAWLDQIGAFAVSRSTDASYTGEQGFAAPVAISVERVKWNKVTNQFANTQDGSLGGDEIWLLAFSTGVEAANGIGRNGPGTDEGGFGGEFIKFYKEEDLTFQFLNVDNGKSISISDVLKISYVGGTLNANQSEIPKPDSSRKTPFGDDTSLYSSGLCYPPYTTVDAALKATAVNDTDLYNAQESDFDVFWGDPTRGSLGGNKLYITEKIEFSFPDGLNESDVVDDVPTNLEINAQDYTHRYQVNLPLRGIDEDALEHIGNLEKVKNSFFLYVNGKTNLSAAESALLPDLP